MTGYLAEEMTAFFSALDRDRAEIEQLSVSDRLTRLASAEATVAVYEKGLKTAVVALKRSRQGYADLRRSLKAVGGLRCNEATDGREHCAKVARELREGEQQLSRSRAAIFRFRKWAAGIRARHDRDLRRAA